MRHQDQSVGAESEGYQAGRDLTINRGLSPDQMAEIMVCLSKQLSSYFVEANNKAEARMLELRNSLINEFTRPDTIGKTNAFTDPDYQFLLRDAQQSYARSGEETLREELTKLLIQRSAQTAGSRTTLILNRAITTVGNLTRQDHAAICAIFFLKYVKIYMVNSEQLIRELKNCVGSFVDALPNDDFSYDYMASLGLISINHLMSANFLDMLQHSYGSAFSSEFLLSDLELAIGDNNTTQKIMPLLFQSGDCIGIKFRFLAATTSELNGYIQEIGIAGDVAAKITIFFEALLMPADKIKTLLFESVPELQKIEGVWEATNLQKASLTALGKIIAHSALTSQSSFRAPLDIWVR